MTREAFAHLTQQLKIGNNKVLEALQPYQSSCIGMLMKKSGNSCKGDDAYDIFIESVLDFRKNVINGKVAFSNIKGYLHRICWNKWLATYRQHQRWRKKESELKYTYSDASIPPEPGDEVSVQEAHLATMKEAMEVLSEKCRDILYWAIVDGFSMEEIAQMIGLANANVAKTTKSRCYQKLISRIKELSSP